MSKLKTCSVFLLLLLLSAAFARDDFDATLMQGKKILQKAIDENDEAGLLKARSLFERLLQAEEMSWLTEYYVGYADYRLAVYHMVAKNREQQIKYLDDGIEHLNSAIENKDDFSDAYGLLSTLIGQKIGTDPSLGMTLGYEAQSLISDAHEFGKENPRVAMFSAISSYYTPEQYGGSGTRAIKEMNQAIELFESENIEDKKLPAWGHDDALAMLAYWYLQDNKTEDAKKSVEAALEVNPNNGFAKGIGERLGQSSSR